MKLEKMIRQSKITKAKVCAEWFINAEPKEIETIDGEKIKCEGVAGLFLFPDGQLTFLYADDDNSIHILPIDKLKFTYTNEQVEKLAQEEVEEE